MANIFKEKSEIIPRMDISLCSDVCSIHKEHKINRNWEIHTHLIKWDKYNVVNGYDCVCNICAGLRIQTLKYTSREKESKEGWSQDDAWTSNSNVFPKIKVMSSLKKKLDINGNQIYFKGIPVSYVEDRYLDTKQMRNDDAGDYFKNWKPKYVDTKNIVDKTHVLTIKDISV